MPCLPGFGLSSWGGLFERTSNLRILGEQAMKSELLIASESKWPHAAWSHILAPGAAGSSAHLGQSLGAVGGRELQ